MRSVLKLFPTMYSDDDDAVGHWCKVAGIAAENAKQKMPAPKNETGIRARMAVCLQRSTDWP